MFWFIGGADPVAWEEAFLANRINEDVPFNHSPRYAPIQDPNHYHRNRGHARRRDVLAGTRSRRLTGYEPAQRHDHPQRPPRDRPDLVAASVLARSC
jgi:hypothetical protein